MSSSVKYKWLPVKLTGFFPVIITGKRTHLSSFGDIKLISVSIAILIAITRETLKDGSKAMGTKPSGQNGVFHRNSEGL
jgi:hypothetical protein